jgi:hypothetical protein
VEKCPFCEVLLIHDVSGLCFHLLLIFCHDAKRIYMRFGETCYIHFQGKRLKMKAAQFSLKCQYVSTRLHDVTSQQQVCFINITMRTLRLTFYSVLNWMMILFSTHRRRVRYCYLVEKFSCKIQCVIVGVNINASVQFESYVSSAFLFYFEENSL